MASTLTQRRFALYALFMLPGIAMSAWVTRTPAVRDLLGASIAEMGLVLFGLSVGSMIGILCSGPLVSRFSTRPTIIIGACLLIVSLPTISVGAVIGSGALTAFGLALFGAGMGGSEVAMNVEGGDIERLSHRPFLPGLHGCFSLGTIIGSGLGLLANSTQFSVVAHLGLISLLGIIVVVTAARHIAIGTGRITEAQREHLKDQPKVPVWKDARLVLIGCIVLAMAMAEGTANDWMPLLMVDGHDFTSTTGSAIYMVFGAAMILARFGSAPLVLRFGRATMLASSAASATLGLLAVAFLNAPALVITGVILWGLGTALGFPLALSAAGDTGVNSTSRIALASTLGYIAFLVGPPTLGFIGDHIGLRLALVVPAALVVIAGFFSPAVKERNA